MHAWRGWAVPQPILIAGHESYTSLARIWGISEAEIVPHNVV